MKTPCIIFSLVVVFGFAVGLVREHIFINLYLPWGEAQQFCRQNYRDLSTIITKEDNEMALQSAGQYNYYNWIGLYKNKSDFSQWIWSDERSSSKWEYGDNGWYYQNCIMMGYTGLFYDDYCWNSRTFFCERILVMVKENKTWEEAYEYCKAHYTGLAFLSSQAQLNLAKKETNDTQTVRVWTGLRFLAGEWLWVNGEPLGSLVSLPLCPAQSYRCGARNSKMDIWENRDCEEKLNFLCYW